MTPLQSANSCRIRSVCTHRAGPEPSLNIGHRQKKAYTQLDQIFSRIFSSVLNTSSIYRDEGGMVTAVALLLVAALTLLGTSAVVLTSTDLLIGGNYKLSEQSFYAAEAGIEEARARLRGNAVAKINDTAPSSPDWKAYIGTLAMAQAKGFNPGSASHSRADSLQTDMKYVVEIRHKVDKVNPTKVMYWDGMLKRNTTTGANIYLVSSTGSTGNANRTVEAEVTRALPITVPGPLYVKSETALKGKSTDILGLDPVTGNAPCGGPPVPGITTTKVGSSIDQGQANVTGSPKIKELAEDLDIDGMVNSLKHQANFSYNVTSQADRTKTGMNWGTPTLGANLEDPSTCSVHNIVYYNTNEIGVRLAGGTSGCGILLVDGDLDVDGGFAWHGVIVVTGSLKYLGGGDKQVTGGMLSGGTVDADVEIGGNANIVYCSSAINSQTVNLSLRILSWRDDNQK